VNGLSTLLGLDSPALPAWDLYCPFSLAYYHWDYRCYPAGSNDGVCCLFLIQGFGLLPFLLLLVLCWVVFHKLLVYGGFWKPVVVFRLVFHLLVLSTQTLGQEGFSTGRGVVKDNCWKLNETNNKGKMVVANPTVPLGQVVGHALYTSRRLTLVGGGNDYREPR